MLCAPGMLRHMRSLRSMRRDHGELAAQAEPCPYISAALLHPAIHNASSPRPDFYICVPGRSINSCPLALQPHVGWIHTLLEEAENERM